TSCPARCFGAGGAWCPGLQKFAGSATSGLPGSAGLPVDARTIPWNRVARPSRRRLRTGGCRQDIAVEYDCSQAITRKTAHRKLGGSRYTRYTREKYELFISLLEAFDPQ